MKLSLTVRLDAVNEPTLREDPDGVTRHMSHVTCNLVTCDLVTPLECGGSDPSEETVYFALVDDEKAVLDYTCHA